MNARGENNEAMLQGIHRRFLHELARSTNLELGLQEVLLNDLHNRLVTDLSRSSDTESGLGSILGPVADRREVARHAPEDSPRIETGSEAQDSLRIGEVAPTFSNEEHRCRPKDSPNYNRVDLTGVSFAGQDLTSVSFSEAVLVSADFAEAELVDACLRSADARRANLTRANLLRADLRGTNLTLAVLRGANLAGADLRHADLQGAAFDIEDLEGATWDTTTKWSPAVRQEIMGDSVEVSEGVFEVQTEPPEPIGASLRRR